MLSLYRLFLFFFFNDTATTEIYTLSLHDALPILREPGVQRHGIRDKHADEYGGAQFPDREIARHRSEEHTSELQSQSNLVCRLLLEKKKTFTFCLRPALPILLFTLLLTFAV